MNQPEPDAPISAPAWQTPVLVPLLHTNDAAGGKNPGASETSTNVGPS